VAKVTFVGPNGGNYAIIRAGVPGTVQVRTSTEGKTGTSTITVR
jgi:hypothetical protein